jgi:hypothetical protein
MNINVINQTTTEFTTIAFVARQLQQMVEDAFTDNWLQICQVQRTQYFHLKTIASGTGAIIALRSILQMENITAEMRGDIIHVWPCIDITDYELRKESSCYDSIPISFKLNNHTVNNAFLKATHLRAVVYDDIPLSCNRIRESYFKTVREEFVEWNGKRIRKIDLHVTDISMALTFKHHESFHLNSANVYDDKNQILDHLIDLTELSSTVRAITKLLTMSSSESEIDIESLKRIARHLGNSTENLFDSVLHSLGRLLPPRWVVYLAFAICISIVIGLVALAIFLRCRSKVSWIVPHQTKEESQRSQLGTELGEINATVNTVSTLSEVDVLTDQIVRPDNEVSEIHTVQQQTATNSTSPLTQITTENKTDNTKPRKSSHPTVMRFQQLLKQDELN